LRAESEANVTQIGKRRIFFAVGTEAKIIKFISEGNTAYLLFINLIQKKTSNQYGRVQKSNSRNTLRE